ncbi:WD40 repeat domain-containing protein [Thermocatellispora tengchongensis]|uniref:WD40 repeat domain-containing protein n=1 Tax=Thermocatellispora tengchongensis TaxID=1073253 RepID=UPI00363B687B
MTLARFERDFLRACTELTKKRARRRKLTTATLAVLLATALAASGMVLVQREEVAEQRDIATAKQAAAEADRIRAIDPTAAMLLSVAAWRVSSQPETRSSLTASLQQRETAVFRDPPVRGVASRALSRDGRTLVSVSEDGLNVYDVRTGRRTAGLARLGLDGDLAQNPVLSKSGRLVAVRTWRKLAVWDLASGRRLIHLDHPQGTDAPKDVLFGEHETTLVARYAGFLDFVLDVSTGAITRNEPETLSAVAHLLDPAGERLLLTGDRFEELSLPGLTRQRRYAACRDRPWLAAFSEDGRSLACVGEEGVAILDAATGRLRSDSFEETLEWSCDICGKDGARLRFDGRHLVAFAGRDLRVWRLADFGSVLSYRAEGELTDVGLDPGGTTLRYLMDDAVVTVDLAPRITSTPMEGPAVLSPDGRWAAVHDPWDQELRLLALPGRREIARFPITSESHLTATGFDRTGTRLLIAESPHRVRLIDLTTLQQLWTVPAPRENPPHTAVFSPDGRIIALLMGPPGQMGDSRVVVYDAATGRVLHDHRTATYPLGPFTADGKTLATASGRFLDVTTGEPVGRGYDDSYFGGPALSGTGLMAVGQDESGRIALWNVHGPTPVRPALPRAAGTISTMTFSPDGGMLVTLTQDGTIQLWDPEAGRRVGGSFKVNNEARYLDSMTFSADGRTLYVAADDMLHEIPVDPDRVAAAVCERAGTTLSRQQWARYLPAVPYRPICR